MTLTILIFRKLAHDIHGAAYRPLSPFDFLISQKYAYAHAASLFFFFLSVPGMDILGV
jgi:hypothetical protein